jgi:uncharacterized membrane protein
MRLLQKLQTISRIVQGIIYIVASVFHFVNDTELRIIPPFLPLRRTALYITGICEFLGGLGLLIPRFQRSAAWGLAALLIAIWPANAYHTFLDYHSKQWHQRRFYHIMRHPMQVVFIAWVLWATNRKAIV